MTQGLGRPRAAYLENGFGLFLVCLVLLAVPGNMQGQIDSLDHFRCYLAQDFLGQPVNAPVLLFDQFDQIEQRIELGRVARVNRFCNPVEKQDETGGVTPIVDPRHHLTFYSLRTRSEPVERDFQVENQFGVQNIRTSRAVVLAVPTDKNSEGEPENLDHFKCYRAQGAPVNRTVGLFDQFLVSPAVQVGAPFLFCNPTVKFHAGQVTRTQNPEAHLTCYQTSRTDYADLITIRNQFHATELQVGRAESLCVPSRKILDPGLPDLTIRLPNRVGVTCPGGAGTCTSTVDYEIHEIGGVAVTANFTVRIRNSAGQSSSFVVAGIAANGSQTGTVTLGPPGANCYNPDCTTTGEVDIPFPGVVPEADEGNNIDTRIDQG